MKMNLKLIQRIKWILFFLIAALFIGYALQQYN